jgi:hypothetical protein
LHSIRLLQHEIWGPRAMVHPRKAPYVDHPSMWLSELHAAAHCTPFDVALPICVAFQKRLQTCCRPFSSDGLAHENCIESHTRSSDMSNTSDIKALELGLVRRRRRYAWSIWGHMMSRLWTYLRCSSGHTLGPLKAKGSRRLVGSLSVTKSISRRDAPPRLPVRLPV